MVNEKRNYCLTYWPISLVLANVGRVYVCAMVRPLSQFENAANQTFETAQHFLKVLFPALTSTSATKEITYSYGIYPEEHAIL